MVLIEQRCSVKKRINVEKILLEAIQSVETGVMKKPKPYILFAGVNE